MQMFRYETAIRNFGSSIPEGSVVMLKSSDSPVEFAKPSSRAACGSKLSRETGEGSRKSGLGALLEENDAAVGRWWRLRMKTRGQRGAHVFAPCRGDPNQGSQSL